eukprot:scaffold46400_cov51-Phaeocystis_antarctica.AAC.2
MIRRSSARLCVLVLFKGFVPYRGAASERPAFRPTAAEPCLRTPLLLCSVRATTRGQAALR